MEYDIAYVIHIGVGINYFLMRTPSPRVVCITELLSDVNFKTRYSSVITC